GGWHHSFFADPVEAGRASTPGPKHADGRSAPVRKPNPLHSTAAANPAHSRSGLPPAKYQACSVIREADRKLPTGSSPTLARRRPGAPWEHACHLRGPCSPRSSRSRTEPVELAMEPVKRSDHRFGHRREPSHRPDAIPKTPTNN